MPELRGSGVVLNQLACLPPSAAVPGGISSHKLWNLIGNHWYSILNWHGFSRIISHWAEGQEKVAGQRKSICLDQLQSTDINPHPFIGTAGSQHGQPGGTATAPSPHPMALHQPQNCALFFVIAGFPHLFSVFCRWNWAFHVLCTSEHLTATNWKAALWPLNLTIWIEKLYRGPNCLLFVFTSTISLLAPAKEDFSLLFLSHRFASEKKKKEKCMGGVFNVKIPIAICFYIVSSPDAFHAGIVKTQLRQSSQDLCRWRFWGSEGCKELLYSVWQEAIACFHSKLHFHAGWAQHLEIYWKYWRTDYRNFSCFCIGELSNFVT